MQNIANALRFIVFVLLSSFLFWGLVKLSFIPRYMYDTFLDGFLPNIPIVLSMALRFFVGAILFGALALLVSKLNPNNKYSRVAILVLYFLSIMGGIKEVWTIFKQQYAVYFDEFAIHKYVMLLLFLIIATKVAVRLNKGEFA